MCHRVRSEPLADPLLLGRLPRQGDLVQRKGCRLVVLEAVHDPQVRFVPRLRRPLPVSAQVQLEQGLGENHLATAQHAAPALVAGVLRAADGDETAPVGAPQPALNVAADLVEVCGLRGGRWGIFLRFYQKGSTVFIYVRTQCTTSDLDIFKKNLWFLFLKVS